MKKHFKPNWALLWLLQFVLTCVVSALASLSMLLGGTGHILCLYILLPVLDAVIAGRCVFAGLNNYLALIPVPIALILCHLIIWGYLPSAAPVFIGTFVTVFGSAFGEVEKQRKKPKQR